MTKILKLPTPHYYQRIIYEDPTRFKVIACGRRYGKPLALNTPIFTFNKGFITVGELEIGDYVVASDGKPTKVIYLSPIELKEGYEFAFSTGERIQAGDTHDWFVYSKLARFNFNKIVSVNSGGKKLTSQEIVDDFYYGKNRVPNYAVKSLPPLDFQNFETDELPIHPYVLGIWLANCVSFKELFFGVNEEIFDRVKSLFFSGSWEYKNYKDKFNVYNEELAKELKRLSLVENKHIPSIYLSSSFENRVELLKGFLDIAGDINPKTNFVKMSLPDFGTSLIKDFSFLIRSLGIHSITTENFKHFEQNNKKGTVCFNFSVKDFNPFHLSRKSGLAKKSIEEVAQNLYRKWIYFTDFKKLEYPRFMRCVGVEDEDHLFAVGETFILTHNTELGKIIAAKYLLEGKEVYWVSPTYRMSTEVWRSLKSTFESVVRQKSEQERWMEIYSRGMLRVFSGEHADKIRGGSPHLAVIDECAFINNSDLWSAVLRPALADNEGSALFLSTPKGKGNWFYDVYQMGRDPDNELYKSWRMPTWYNPYINRNEIIDAKKTLPEKLFLQEFAARFLTDAGEVFVGVSKVAKAYRLEPYKGRFVMGADLGRKGDYTVISVIDSNNMTQVELYRFNKITWSAIREKIIEIYRAWNPVSFLVEQNSAGDVIIDDLRQNGIAVTGFQTSNTSKRQIIERLAMAIQNQEITLLNDKDLIYEFQAMQKGYTSTGLPTYSAPSGSHDDIVIATALSWHALKNGRLMFGSAIPIL